MTDATFPDTKAKETKLFPPLKDMAILAGWIGGLILIAFLLWFFTQPARDRLLQRAVNRALEQAGDSRRLEETVISLPSFGMGTFFAVTEVSGENAEGARACVFLFIGGGSFFPCVAMLGSDGNVLDFLPLNSHGERMLKRVPSGVLKLYTRRIEGAES